MESRKPSYLPSKAFYFFHFAAFCCLAPYLALYYEAKGLTGRQIGVLAALPYFLSPLAIPIWAGVGDRSQRHKQLVLILLAATIVWVGGIAFSARFATLLPMVALFAFCVTPIMPMIDNTTLELLGDDHHHYGRLRLWGTVGWGVFSPAIGWLIDRTSYFSGFAGYWALEVVALLVALTLPVRRVPLTGRYWTNMRQLMANRRWLHFLSMALFGGIGMTFVHVYLFLALGHMGASKLLMGWSMFVATGSELGLFLISAKLLRLGPQRLFNVSMVLLLVRLALTGLIEDPRWILPIQLLHGCTFGTMWLAGVAYAKATSPPGLGATAQGVFLATFMGLGSGLGSLLGGELLPGGAHGMYLGATVVVGIGFAIYIVVGLLVPGLGLSLRRAGR
jgi:MFS family permease